MRDDKGTPLGTKVFKPEDIYPVARGVPPDLIVYLGGLKWRSVGSIGYGTILTYDNDIGPDDANHAEEGLCIIHDPGETAHKPALFREDLDILDIAPTVLNLMGVPVPEGMRGKIITDNN